MIKFGRLRQENHKLGPDWLQKRKLLSGKNKKRWRINYHTTTDVLWYMVLTLGEVKGELFMLSAQFCCESKMAILCGVVMNLLET